MKRRYRESIDSQIIICKEGMSLNELRNRQIYDERKAGAKLQVLVDKYGLSRECIRQICVGIDAHKELMKNKVYRLCHEVAPDDERLGTKIFNILKRHGYYTEDKIVLLEDKKLKNIRTCGSKCERLIQEVRDTIKKENG